MGLNITQALTNAKQSGTFGFVKIRGGSGRNKGNTEKLDEYHIGLPIYRTRNNLEQAALVLAAVLEKANIEYDVFVDFRAQQGRSAKTNQKSKVPEGLENAFGFNEDDTTQSAGAETNRQQFEIKIYHNPSIQDWDGLLLNCFQELLKANVQMDSGKNRFYDIVPPSMTGFNQPLQSPFRFNALPNPALAMDTDRLAQIIKDHQHSTVGQVAKICLIILLTALVAAASMTLCAWMASMLSSDIANTTAGLLTMLDLLADTIPKWVQWCDGACVLLTLATAAYSTHQCFYKPSDYRDAQIVEVASGLQGMLLTAS